MNVKLVRTTSGEDVICEVLSETDDSVTFSNAIVAVPAGNGQIGFAPWSPLLSKEVKELTIDKKFVMYIACLLYTSPSPRDLSTSRMPSSA